MAVQGQWWSILGMHLGDVRICGLLQNLGVEGGGRICNYHRDLGSGYGMKNTLPLAFFAMMSPRWLHSVAFPTPFRPFHAISFLLCACTLLFLTFFPIALRYRPRIHKHRLRIRDEDQHEHHITNIELRPRQRRRLQIIKKSLRRVAKEENQKINAGHRDLVE